MAEVTNTELDAAEARGRLLTANEPRAASARFDAGHGRVVLDLTNGCTFAFPARIVQGLERASDAELAEVAVLGSGYALHWPTLDVDITVPGILAGVFGTQGYMARLAGRTTSPAKALLHRS